MDDVRMAALRDVAMGFDTHRLELIMRHFAADATFESPRGPELWGQRFVGSEALRGAFAGRFESIPDVRYRDDTHFVSADRGVSQWTLTGTTREGERLAFHGCDLWTFRHELIVKKDSYWKIRTRG
jgi:ketosteroid isomerase-like protein